MKHIESLIPRWLAGQLDPQEQGRFEAHVQECPECARQVAESRTVWEALEDPPARREADRAPSVWDAVRERTVARSSEPWFYGSTAWLRNGMAAGAVAAGLLCAILLPLGDQSSAQATESDVETIWTQDSSWNEAAGDESLDTLWLNAGLATEE